MLTDSIADMITRIRNAQQRQKEEIEFPYSKTKEAIAKVLKENNFIDDVKVFKPKEKSYKYLNIKLKYNENGEPAIKSIERISRPGLREYKKVKDIRPVLSGLGIYIVSTSRGVVSSIEARKKNLGGEVLCRVY